MSSVLRTDLTSQPVDVTTRKLGEGRFRICLEGYFIGRNGNKELVACKRFKSQWRDIVNEYFAVEFKIIDVAIFFANEWNKYWSEIFFIMISRGTIVTSNIGFQFLVEPAIRNFTKFTSNTGWINPYGGVETLAIEAFSHFTYHMSGGRYLVCDLQGRYHDNTRHRNKKSRFELTNLAICSVAREFGPTDLGEKGIESFFSNHLCNAFCNHTGWRRPRSSDSHKLVVHKRTQYRMSELRFIMGK